MAAQQLLREWPPGYGGVERVAHELASVWGGVVYSLDAQPQRRLDPDPLPVSYKRCQLSRMAIGRLLLPMPSPALLALLFSPQPLHGHLPSPGVLILLLLARVIRPRRRVTAHWHCFLHPTLDLNGRLFSLYQWLALRVVRRLSGVLTTSPLLRQELLLAGCSKENVYVLPCCLSIEQENAALMLQVNKSRSSLPLRVLFIGRLESYKRLDWLFQALVMLSSPWNLVVVGDGPKRRFFEKLCSKLIGSNSDDRVTFCGRLSEADKLEQLALADVLVLPSDRSNEAFGIVQLEAMAAALPSLAFDLPRSGMGWVGQLPSLQWSQSQEGLADVLQRLAEDSELLSLASSQSRDRYHRLFARKVWRQHLNSFGFLQ